MTVADVICFHVEKIIVDGIRDEHQLLVPHRKVIGA